MNGYYKEAESLRRSVANAQARREKWIVVGGGMTTADVISRMAQVQERKGDDRRKRRADRIAAEMATTNGSHRWLFLRMLLNAARKVNA